MTKRKVTGGGLTAKPWAVMEMAIAAGVAAGIRHALKHSDTMSLTDYDVAALQAQIEHDVGAAVDEWFDFDSPPPVENTR